MADAGTMLSKTVHGADAMRALGRRLGSSLAPGDVILLHGDLGAGKTTLAQGTAEALGVEGAIQSPTFTLVSEYPARLADGTAVTLFHLDLYRLHDAEELGDIGWDELIAADAGVTVVEWPERAGDWLPERYTLVTIEHVGPDARRVSIHKAVT